jgi:helix-turn-helix protein
MYNLAINHFFILEAKITHLFYGNDKNSSNIIYYFQYIYSKQMSETEFTTTKTSKIVIVKDVTRLSSLMFFLHNPKLDFDPFGFVV